MRRRMLDNPWLRLVVLMTDVYWIGRGDHPGLPWMWPVYVFAAVTFINLGCDAADWRARSGKAALVAACSVRP